jgi:hypothetical protein
MKLRSSSPYTLTLQEHTKTSHQHSVRICFPHLYYVLTIFLAQVLYESSEVFWCASLTARFLSLYLSLSLSHTHTHTQNTDIMTAYHNPDVQICLPGCTAV